MELRGVEPLSESPFIAVSPITVSLLCELEVHFSLHQTPIDRLLVLVASYFFHPLKALKMEVPANLMPGF